MKIRILLLAIPAMFAFACQSGHDHDHSHDCQEEHNHEMKSMELLAGDIANDLYAFDDLPYEANELEPYIDHEIMILHYDKHHKGYYKKFLKAIEGSEAYGQKLSEVFSLVSNYSDAIRNNGGGYYNHWIFWTSLSPDGGEISTELELAITKDFGSMESFKESFNKAAKTQFGSGWAWLILSEDMHLKIVQTSNQDNPLMDIANDQGIPLMALDVWEHAYYLQYENRRAEYIDNFWNIINWNEINKRYEMALDGQIYNP